MQLILCVREIYKVNRYKYGAIIKTQYSSRGWHCCQVFRAKERIDQEQQRPTSTKSDETEDNLRTDNTNK